MKKKLIIIPFFLFLIGCIKPTERRCFKSSGQITALTINNVIANEISVNQDIAVVLIQDSLNFVTLEGGENILPFVEVSVENNTATFSNNNTCNFSRKRIPLTIYYHYTSLSKIDLNGFGDLSNEGEITSDLNIEANESFSNIFLNIKSKNLKIIGQVESIDAKITGTCDDLYLYTNGGGNLDAGQLITKHAHGHNQGLGDIYLQATEIINIELRSKGSFHIVNSSNAVIEIIGNGTGQVFYE